MAFAMKLTCSTVCDIRIWQSILLQLSLSNYLYTRVSLLGVQWLFETFCIVTGFLSVYIHSSRYVSCACVGWNISSAISPAWDYWFLETVRIRLHVITSETLSVNLFSFSLIIFNLCRYIKRFVFRTRNSPSNWNVRSRPRRLSY